MKNEFLFLSMFNDLILVRKLERWCVCVVLVRIFETPSSLNLEENNTTNSLPRTSISPLIKSHKFTQQEHVYAYCGWKFTYHFLSRLSSEVNLVRFFCIRLSFFWISRWSSTPILHVRWGKIFVVKFDLKEEQEQENSSFLLFFYFF